MSLVPLRVVIADDERAARERLRLLCSELEGVEVTGMAVNGIEAVRAAARLRPDVMMLDIAMPDPNGLAVARALIAGEAPPAMIFCTALDRHALAAFEVSAIDYLLKPVGRDRLARALEKARSYAPQGAREKMEWLDHLWVPHRQAMLRLPVSAIERLEAERDYVRLWVGDVSYLVHETMQNLESRLDPSRFVRIHRSTIVRIDRIDGLEHDGLGAWKARLANGTSMRIGPSYLKRSKTRIGLTLGTRLSI